jgi:cytochrome c-type biogenesis protein CcmH
MTAFMTVLTLGLLLTPAAQPADIEREAHEIEAMLIAPCCFSQQVSLHQSPATDEVRVDVRRRLAAGETREQILQAYVAQYGKRILVEPPAEGFDRILYVLPPLGLVVTGLLVVMVVRRFAARGVVNPAPAAEAGVSPEGRYGAALDDQLRDLD